MAFTVNRYTKTNEDVASLSKIKERILHAAKESQAAGRRDELLVEIEGGWHFCDEPLVLSAKENPELNSLKLTLTAKESHAPHIHSFLRIEGCEFARTAGKPYYTYRIAGEVPKFHDLFVNALPVPMATSPVWRNPDILTPEERRGEAIRRGFYVPYEIAARLAREPISAATELVIYVEWEFTALHVTGVDLSDTREYDGKKHALVLIREEEIKDFTKNCHSELNIMNREVFFRNSPAFLSEPDTYTYDYTTGEIRYIPAEGKEMGRSFVQYPVAENYFILEGLSDVTVRGITFTGTTCRHLCTSHYHSGQANALYRGEERGDHERRRLPVAALLTKDVKNITVTDCRFIDLGTNGIQMTDESDGVTVRDCFFENVSMSAVCIGNPDVNWDEPRNRNRNIHIENNLFRRIAYDYPTAMPIYVGIVDGVKILHNTIRGCAYSGMSVGWGWRRVYYARGEKCNIHNAEIAYNRIENWMDVLRDGGAIYVVGGNCDTKNTERFNRMHHNYAHLDTCHDKSKFGYYCDGSSTNWDVCDNVITGCLRPLFSQCVSESSLSYHNHFHNIYANTPYEDFCVGPDRDVLYYDYHLLDGDEEALFKAFPEAKTIRDEAGYQGFYC